MPVSAALIVTRFSVASGLDTRMAPPPPIPPKLADVEWLCPGSLTSCTWLADAVPVLALNVCAWFIDVTAVVPDPV